MQYECIELAKKIRNVSKGESEVHVFMVGNNPASETYVKNKKKALLECGYTVVTHYYSESGLIMAKLMNDLKNISNKYPTILQLPLPERLVPFTDLLLKRINSENDIDGLSPENVSALYTCKNYLELDNPLPCTALGVMHVIRELKKSDDLSEYKVCVVGRSNLVGKPVAKMCMDLNATVTVCHSHTANLKKHTQNADIVILATGKSRYFDSTYFKAGSLIIDVGINKDDYGNIHGDLDSETLDPEQVDWTAVPNGIGKMTVAYVCNNVYKIINKNTECELVK